MKTWQPQPTPFRYALLLSPLLSLALAAWLWTRLSGRVSVVDFDPGVFLLGFALFLALLLTGLLAYVARCASTIRYTLDSRHLIIRYGGVGYTIPLPSITEVYAPGNAGGGKSMVIRWLGLSAVMPGYVIREGQIAQLGKVVSVATVPAQGQVYVRTARVAFGLSPQQPAEFLAALEERRKAAEIDDDTSLLAEPAPDVRIELRGLGAWGGALWSDILARGLLVAGLALNALFFGYLSLAYGDLPSRLSLHWNAQAQVDRVGSPLELLRLPVFALAVWLVNALVSFWALRRERAVTLFLLAGAVATQVVFWAGALSIVVRAG